METTPLASCVNHTQNKKYGTTKYNSVPTYLHRVAYIKAHGLTLADIADKVVRHKCDNHKCVNPEHLEIGDHVDNHRDMWERGRKVAPHAVHYEAIRAEYVRGSGECGQVALAKKYGLSQTHIRKIINKEIKYGNRLQSIGC